MGKRGEALYAFFKANACICKGISIFLILLSAALIIAGAVLVAKYRGDYDSFIADFEDFFEDDSWVWIYAFSFM